ncbi:hypothetical protein PsorP6_012573 [Peronosclerospora sorghi]|uniref:Uncharacterized protein n=1 Tax=Peronosclerospora sorghi TaxID=230839 RepID=A0ACC0WG87_9STRA|nr:hypothetical protein PsorP6_012573 [Peronosclerospora sorghi]
MSGTERKMDKQATESFQLKLYMYAFCQGFGEAPYGAKLQEIGGNYSQQSSKARGVKCGKVGDAFVHFPEKSAQEAEDTIVEVGGEQARHLRKLSQVSVSTFSALEACICKQNSHSDHFNTSKTILSLVLDGYIHW